MKKILVSLVLIAMLICVVFLASCDIFHYHDGELLVIKEATCTEKGLAHMYCTDCGELIKIVNIPKTGHNTIIVPGEKATHDYDGLTDGEFCTKCFKMIVEQKVIPAGCTESQWIIDKVSTYTEYGSKHTECMECGKWLKTEKVDTKSPFYFYKNDDGYSLIGVDFEYISKINTDIVIPSTYNGELVTSIGSKVFYNCDSLTSVLIPYFVRSIGEDAFAACDSLRSVKIPYSVRSIGYGAFSACYSLTIYCEAESQPAGWNSNWNYSNCPVVWGYYMGVNN